MRQRVVFTTILCVSLLTLACSPIPPGAVREVIEDSLLDPESVQYRNVHETSWIDAQNGHLHIGLCGELNAKNHMGGYAGFRRFIFVASDIFGPDKVWIDGEDKLITDLFPDMWANAHCQ